MSLTGLNEKYLKSKFGKLTDDELLRMEEQTKWDIAHLQKQIFDIKCEKQRRLELWKIEVKHDK